MNQWRKQKTDISRQHIHRFNVKLSERSSTYSPLQETKISPKLRPSDIWNFLPIQSHWLSRWERGKQVSAVDIRVGENWSWPLLTCTTVKVRHFRKMKLNDTWNLSTIQSYTKSMTHAESMYQVFDTRLVNKKLSEQTPTYTTAKSKLLEGKAKWNLEFFYHKAGSW